MAFAMKDQAMQPLFYRLLMRKGRENRAICNIQLMIPLFQQPYLFRRGGPFFVTLQ